MSGDEHTVSLSFPLTVEDGWPPVAVECLPFRISGGRYTALAPPLFVRDLSVGDVLEVMADAAGRVESWRHLVRSRNTTIWLLRLASDSNVEAALADLRALGCNSVGLVKVGAYAVDVPASVGIASVDQVLSALDASAVAVAFPSMRHEG